MFTFSSFACLLFLAIIFVDKNKTRITFSATPTQLYSKLSKFINTERKIEVRRYKKNPRPSSSLNKSFLVVLFEKTGRGGGKRERTDSPMSLDCRPLPSEFHSSSATRKGDTGPLASKLRNEAREFGRRLAPRNEGGRNLRKVYRGSYVPPRGLRDAN